MYALFDIGGNKIRIAVSSDGKTFSQPSIFKTPESDFDEAIRRIQEEVKKCAQGNKIQAAVGGVRSLNTEKTALRNQPVFPMWVNEPLKTRLEEALGAPVFLENDAALAGLGEACVGAGKGYRVVMYITISTGIGGARITDGKIDYSGAGFEPGLQLIPAEEGKETYWEEWSSGTALEKRFGILPQEIQDEKIWTSIEQNVAKGLNNSIVHWAPDVVVLGGAMVRKKPGIRIEKVGEQLKKYLRAYENIPPLEEAQLGEVSGLYGAIELIGQLKIKR